MQREDLDREHAGSFGRILDATCRVMALVGGAVLSVIALVSVASIIGRSFGRPLQGDFELVQFGCAVSIAFFLPWCQMRRGNIIVDFFTMRASPRAKSALDACGALLLALVMVIVAWRTGAGAFAMAESGETSMILGVPIWYAYALIAPAFALAAAAGLYTAWRDWKAG